MSTNQELLDALLATRTDPNGYYAAFEAWAQQSVTALDTNPASFQIADTIAVLKALTAVASAARPTALVRGYNSVGDGGGGVFRWDGASSTADDGGTIIALDAGGTGRWKRLPVGYLTLEDFGAVGDGVTDDYDAVVAACAAVAAAGGGRLVGKAGADYLIDFTARSPTVLGTFTDCRGLHFDMPGSTITIDHAFGASEIFDLFNLQGCHNIDLDIGHIVSEQQTIDNTYVRGIRAFYLTGTAASGGCRFLRARWKQTGGVNTIFAYRAPADPVTYELRHAVVDIETVSVGYGLNLANSGSHIRGTLRTNKAFRSVIGYGGIHDIDLHISSANHRSHDVKLYVDTDSSPASLRNIRIDYTMETRDAAWTGGWCVDVEVRAPGPAIIEGIDVTLHIKDTSGFAQTGGGFRLQKSIADGSAYDSTTRGHKVYGVALRGIIEDVQTSTGWTWAPSVVEICDGWGTGETVRNIEIGPLVVTGDTGTDVEINCAPITSNLYVHDIHTAGTVTITGSLPANSIVERVTDKNGVTGWRASSDQQILSASGSAAAPGYTFDGDPDTGMHRPATNTLAFGTSGTMALSVNSSQRVTAGPALDNSGYQFQVNRDDSGSTIAARCQSDSTQPGLNFLRTRAANAAVQSGDFLGQVTFRGRDGSGYSRGAIIQAEVDGSVSAGVMPGRLVFLTSPSGSETPAEWLRLSAAGALTHRGNATTIVDANSHLGLRSYTVATLPSASTAARLINVSDGTSNKRLAISDGTDWRFPDGAVVS